MWPYSVLSYVHGVNKKLDAFYNAILLTIMDQTHCTYSFWDFFFFFFGGGGTGVDRNSLVKFQNTLAFSSYTMYGL